LPNKPLPTSAVNLQESPLAPPTPAQRPILYSLSYLTDFAMAMLVFTLTRYLAEQDGDLLHLGILGTCASLTYAVSAALFGHLSDRLGRRRLIAAGGLVFGAAYGLALWSMSVPLIYLEAALGGLATALVFPPLIALLSAGKSGGDVSSQRTRTLILFCLSWNLGVVSGNVSGGWLFAIDPQIALWLGLGLAALHLTLSLVSALLPGPSAEASAAAEAEATEDPLKPLASEHAPGELTVSPARQRFFAMVGWLANVSGSIAMSLILYVLPKLATDLGIGAPAHGTMVMAARIAVVCTYLLLHFTRYWRFRLWPGILAQVTAMVGLLVLSTAASVPALTAGVMLVGTMMGYNYFSSIFYSTTGFSEGRRGLASGLHEGTLAIGFTIGSLGGGYLGASLGVRVPFQVGVAVLALSILVQAAGYAAFARRQPL